jgi:hypothetical protein
MSKKAMAAESQPKTEHDYQTENDMDTLMRAEEVKQDKHRMQRVAKRVGRKHKAITSLKDLTDVYNQKYGAKSQNSLDDENDMGE